MRKTSGVLWRNTKIGDQWENQREEFNDGQRTGGKERAASSEPTLITPPNRRKDEHRGGGGGKMRKKNDLTFSWTRKKRKPRNYFGVNETRKQGRTDRDGRRKK